MFINKRKHLTAIGTTYAKLEALKYNHQFLLKNCPTVQYIYKSTIGQTTKPKLTTRAVLLLIFILDTAYFLFL